MAEPLTSTTTTRPPRPPRPRQTPVSEPVVQDAPAQDTADSGAVTPEVKVITADNKPKPAKGKKAPVPVADAPSNDETEKTLLARLSVTIEPRHVSPEQISGFNEAVLCNDQADQVARFSAACTLANSRYDRNSELSQAVIDDVAARGQVLDPIRLYYNPETESLEPFDGVTRLLGVIVARQSNPASFESVPALVYHGPIAEVAYLEDTLNSLRTNFSDAERVIAVRQYLNLGGTVDRYLALSGHQANSTLYREAKTLVEVASNSWSAEPVIQGTLSLAAARKIMATADTPAERKRQFEAAAGLVNAKIKEATHRRQTTEPSPTTPGAKPRREVTEKERNNIEREALQSVGAAQVRTRAMTVENQRRQLFEIVSDNPAVADTLISQGEWDWETTDIPDAIVVTKILTRLEILGVPDLRSFVKSATSPERITWLGGLTVNID